MNESGGKGLDEKAVENAVVATSRDEVGEASS
jgi:hypothetical protein